MYIGKHFLSLDHSTIIVCVLHCLVPIFDCIDIMYYFINSISNLIVFMYLIFTFSDSKKFSPISFVINHLTM